ncbi:hypothetical protein PENTCL1PPCAC_3657, partial [Pristionchus entomophagus]
MTTISRPGWSGSVKSTWRSILKNFKINYREINYQGEFVVLNEILFLIICIDPTHELRIYLCMFLCQRPRTLLLDSLRIILVIDQFEFEFHIRTAQLVISIFLAEKDQYIIIVITFLHENSPVHSSHVNLIRAAEGIRDGILANLPNDCPGDRCF